MRIERLGEAEISRNWPWLAALLRPVVEIGQGDGYSLDQVKAKLLRGEMGLASIHVQQGAGLVVVEPGVFDGVFCCWVSYLVGRARGGRREWVAMAREIIAYFESAARAAGCAEIRIGGRHWSRIFPDFERFDDVPNRLRKVL